MSRINPDSNDILAWPLNETSGTTRFNVGTLGSSGDLTDYGNSIGGVTGQIKINNDFRGLYIPGPISPNKDGTGGANAIPVPTNFSLSCWVLVRRQSSNYQHIVSKQYYAGGWSPPYISCGLYMNNSNDGRWISYISTSGTLKSFITSSNYPLPQGKWSHIGQTWDGTNLNTYMNGTLINTTIPGGGAVDNNPTNPGKWFIGCVPDTGTFDAPYIIVQDVRVADIVRPQSYFADIYFNGLQP